MSYRALATRARLDRAAAAWCLAGLFALGAPAGALDPHLDPGLVAASCAACHEGHGVSRSPMLPGPVNELCLTCHGSRVQADRRKGAGVITFSAEPTLLSSTLSQPYTHPLSDAALSRHDEGAVTCTSCHSPHRAAPQAAAGGPSMSGTRKLSPRDASRFEYELCQSCHGAKGIATQSLFDLSRLTSPSNRSYHPIEAPTLDRSPSTVQELAGREINCTDCHGNSDPAGPAGPHGSAVPFLLVDEYTTVDGSAEVAGSYALCYRCHDRTRLLDGSPFPLHRLHVVDARASCASCHNAHGSVDNRALIRFGEETFVGTVGPSLATGRLAFESASPGRGSCQLTCHGIDHAPESYGSGGGLESGPATFRRSR